MDSLQELQAAIISIWSIDGCTLHFSKARERTAYPYAVFMIDADAVYTTTSSYQPVTIQFNIFSSSDTSAELHTILSGVKQLFEKQKIYSKMPVAMKIQTQTIFINDSNHFQGTIIFNAAITE